MRASATVPALRDAVAVVSELQEAIRDELTLLASLGNMEEVSLWWVGEDGKLRLHESVHGGPSRGVRAAAHAALRGEDTPAAPRRTLIAAAIAAPGRPERAPDPPVAALAARIPRGTSAQGLALFAEASPLLGLTLERHVMLEEKERQAAVVLATERRLMRFGLDLHDGPAQEAAALLSDLRMLERQVASELAEHPRGVILTGRLQDLEHRVRSLDAAIRELARTAGGPAVIDGPMAPTLRAEVTAFAQSTGIEASLTVTGALDDSTPSQRITLLRGVQEALRNAREHSGARSVQVVVDAPPGRLEARIEDDGTGFDVERAFARARRKGRLGLGGIRERARMLGGACEIRSGPGGPTAVIVALPRWKPGEAPGLSPGGPA